MRLGDDQVSRTTNISPDGIVRQTPLEPGRARASRSGMTKRSPFRYFKKSPELIRLAVMMYVRFPLSLRNVEDLLHEREWRRYKSMT